MLPKLPEGRSNTANLGVALIFSMVETVAMENQQGWPVSFAR